VLRWWFCRDVAETPDTDFTIERLLSRTNEDLADEIGNLIDRIVSLVHRYLDGTVRSIEAELLGRLPSCPTEQGS